MVEMKKKFRVEWYDYDLTQPRCRKFFTEIGANIFAWWKTYKDKVKTRIINESTSITY